MKERRVGNEVADVDRALKTRIFLCDFRLMRTVQSLLSMREPDLSRIASIEDNALSSSSIQDDLSSHEAAYDPHRGNDNCNNDDPNVTSKVSCFLSSTLNHRRSVNTPFDLTVDHLSGARESMDATSLHSVCSKNTEEEELTNTTVPLETTRNDSAASNAVEIDNKSERKRVEESSVNRSKPTASVSSAEDESGFSSMSSFQEVGLPSNNVAPIKGCHTEVGLPEVPLEKIRHRRWSSTPAEIQALFKRHSTSFSNTRSTTESLSVWV